MHKPNLAAAAATLAVAALLLAGCSRDKSRFRLEGSISGIQQAEFYVYSDDGAFEGIDTVRIEGGDFVYERRLTAPAVLTLLYPNFSRTYVVAEPGTDVEMEGDASKLGESNISGTPDNELLTTFRRDNAAKPAATARLAATDFIRGHKQSLAAVAVFKKYFDSAESPDAATTLSLLDDLCRARPRDAALATMALRLRRRLATAQGQPLPDFALTALDGTTVSRTQFSTRPLVVAFWAEWADGAYEHLDALRRIRRAYGSRVGVLLVSLDADPAALRRRLERDSLTCPAVCDGLAFEGKAARTFGARYVPGNLLVGADGRIVARDLTPAELERRVADISK